MSLRANYGYIIVKPHVCHSVTPGGIALPEKSLKPLGQGLVVDNDNSYDEDLIKAGDTVFYIPFSGHEIEYKGQKLLILKDDQVLAVEKHD